MKADRANWVPKPFITAINLYAKPSQATVCTAQLAPTHLTGKDSLAYVFF
jgi:hypothetical protein